MSKSHWHRLRKRVYIVWRGDQSLQWFAASVLTHITRALLPKYIIPTPQFYGSPIHMVWVEKGEHPADKLHQWTAVMFLYAQAPVADHNALIWFRRIVVLSWAVLWKFYLYCLRKKKRRDSSDIKCMASTCTSSVLVNLRPSLLLVLCFGQLIASRWSRKTFLYTWCFNQSICMGFFRIFWCNG